MVVGFSSHRRAFGLLAALHAIACTDFISPAAGQRETADARRFELRVEAGRLVKGEKTIRVKQGENVVLRWTADRTTVVHLHGYDIESTIEPSAPAEMSLVARLTGRFPVEIHASAGAAKTTHNVLLYFEVYPR
jgi:hypothetical protein